VSVVGDAELEGAMPGGDTVIVVLRSALDGVIIVERRIAEV